MYFSQGWALALMRRPLFDTDFEAWKWGPVSYDLYLKHKGEYEVNQIPGGDAAKIFGDDRILIDAVVKNYGGLSGMQLGDLTHQPNTPWTRVRNEHGIPKGQGCRIVIPNQKIEQYFIEALSVERIQSEIAC
ncbi:MAG: DUF4065 domain-containing protein [Corynebacterium sp.]|uniref:Panacea domain-containing protein n=1 Tax=Corynebacterium sp. TaxID=1720 RepID=UPI0026DCF813|nr:type II toxin-antitoxin system antitoxin SocA domain-containing protein [Corynebacterium sp.]MDO4761472.1 DUF4065 domain-containing protein [Corynebacterium sp.]